MGYAILNRLIRLVNKTLKMSFFSRNLSFSQLRLGFGSMTPEKTDLMEGRQQLNWYPETSVCILVLSVWGTSVCIKSWVFLKPQYLYNVYYIWDLSLHQVLSVSVSSDKYISNQGPNIVLTISRTSVCLDCWVLLGPWSLSSVECIWHHTDVHVRIFWRSYSDIS